MFMLLFGAFLKCWRDPRWPLFANNDVIDKANDVITYFFYILIILIDSKNIPIISIKHTELASICMQVHLLISIDIAFSREVIEGGIDLRPLASEDEKRAWSRQRIGLRTVPTFVTAHTFCASRDTRVSYGWCLLIQGYFGAV